MQSPRSQHCRQGVSQGNIGSGLCTRRFQPWPLLLNKPRILAYEQIRNAKGVSRCRGGFSARNRKRGEKANIGGVEVPAWVAGETLQARWEALRCDTGALPAPWWVWCYLQDTSALLLTVLTTSLNWRLIGSSCSLIFTMYYLFSALFRLSSALAK